MSGTIHHLGGTVGEVLENVDGATAAIVIFRRPGEGWRIGWSRMTSEDLCFAHCVFEILVQQHVGGLHQQKGS